MLFGLTNAPTAFMNLMNQVFRPYVDQFIIVFIDDILIYSEFVPDHDRHLKVGLQTLREHRLYAKFRKCQFWIREVAFSGHIALAEGMKVDSANIEVVVAWETPTMPT